MTTQSQTKNVIIVGGHGKVSLKLQSLIHSTHSVTSIIRSESQIPDLTSISPSIKPVILSVEDSPTSDFTKAFEEAKADVVVWSAGAGGKGGAERTKKVDYEGAVKVFDAIEGVSGEKPRLILVSAIDIRDPEKIPEHYNEKDREISQRTRSAIATYMHYKYLADKDLVQRKAFKWFILRPGGLSDEAGKGTVSAGRTHLYPVVSREDVAAVLAQVVDRPESAGLAMDLVGGETKVEEAVDTFVKKGVTDWLG